ncbi:MAG: hypothetical protein WKF81_02060 [Thermomicrobiales bacterium]
MQRVLDIIFGRERDIPDVPVCPDHHIEMHLRGKLGRPTRFAAQTEEEYTLIYYCPAEHCNHTDERQRARTQIPVPNEPPDRPSFARPGDRPA